MLVWRHGLCQRLLFSTVQLDCNVQSIKDWQYCSILHIAYIPHYIAYCTHYPTLYCILHTLHNALRSFLDTNFVHFLPFPPHDTTFMPRKYSITSFLGGGRICESFDNIDLPPFSANSLHFSPFFFSL